MDGVHRGRCAQDNKRMHAPVGSSEFRRRSGASQRGFTLIELMIAVVIVAILAAIALPAYTDHIRKARRADAQSLLSDIVAKQQQFLLDRRAYAVSITDAAAAGGLSITIPGNISAYYSISVETSNDPPPSFKLTATPLGDQAKERCGTLTVDSAGAKTASGAGQCW